MGSKAETIRQDMIKSGCALARHSMDSKVAHEAVHSFRQFYGESKSLARSNRQQDERARRRQYAELAADYRRVQFERVCTKIEEGNATPEDAKYYNKYRPVYVKQHESPDGGTYIDYLPRFYTNEERVPFKDLYLYLEQNFPENQ